MSETTYESQERPWSDNPNAPKIPYWLYYSEKSRFTGVFLGSILYGFIVVLFFQCMAALLDPVSRKNGGIRWWLVSYTTLMFSFATVLTGTGQAAHSICYIDNREYPGVEGLVEPGPLGYRFLMSSGALLVTNNLMFHLSYWLADGFLLYRCYVICSRNLWIIALPCLMYLGSVAVGVMLLISQARGWYGLWNTTNINLSIPYTSISASLNILLTIMIVIRLVLLDRKVRAATGSSTGTSRLCKTIATALIESSALYAASSLLMIGLWAVGSSTTYAFLPALCEVQVIAPLLIIKRVANNSASTRDPIVTGRISSPKVRSRREPTDGSVIPATGDPSDAVRLVDEYGKNCRVFRARVGVETTIDFHQDKI